MTAGTISPWPLVGKADQQHPVKTLQYLLRARGHDVTQMASSAGHLAGARQRDALLLGVSVGRPDPRTRPRSASHTIALRRPRMLS